MKKKLYLLFCIIIAFFFLPHAFSATFLITEVAFKASSTSPSGGLTSDWVEIYCVDDGNAGAGIDISGYDITDLDSTTPDKTINSGTTIKTGEYILLKFNSSDTDETQAGTDGILTINTTNSGLTGTDEQIVFRDATDNILDAAIWADQSGAWSSGEDSQTNDVVNVAQWNSPLESEAIDSSAVGSGKTIGRKPGGADTNSKGDFFVLPSATPGVQNPQDLSGVKIYINEFAISTGLGGLDHDWVELYCEDDGNGGTGVNLGSVYIDDMDGGADFTIPDSTIIKSGEYAIIHYTDGTSDTSADPVLDLYTGSGPSLVSTDDQIVLVDAYGTYLDAVVYTNADGSPTSGEFGNPSDTKTLYDAGAWTDGYNDQSAGFSTGGLHTSKTFGRENSGAINDTNSKNDFLAQTTPTPGAQNDTSGPIPWPDNAKLVINEVSVSGASLGHDWVEIYCVDDGNGGTGLNLKDCYINDLDGGNDLTITTDVTVKTGEYILVHYDTDGTNESDSGAGNGDGIIDLYTGSGHSLVSTDDQIVFYNRFDKIIDAVVYADPPSWTSGEDTDTQQLVNDSQWNSADINDAVNSDLIGSNESFGRLNENDTNTKDDFVRMIIPTPGTFNKIDGTGFATITPSDDVAPNSENTWKIVYIAKTTLDGGKIAFQIPKGWSAPNQNSGTLGYVVWTEDPDPDVSVGNVTINGQTVEIEIIQMRYGDTLTLTYGALSSKARAQSYTGKAVFRVYSMMPGGTLTEIQQSPYVNVRTSSTYDPVIRINEVALSKNVGGESQDWLELYCYDDGNGGAGTDLSGYSIIDHDGTHKVFGRLVIKTGQFILLHYNSSKKDEEELLGDAIDIYTDDPGLVGTDGVIVLKSRGGSTVDVFAYADGEEGDLPENRKTLLEQLANENQWNITYNNASVAERIDCADSSSLSTGDAFMREDETKDTNDKKDWAKTNMPTPGRSNFEGPTDKVILKITEVAMKDKESDWVEVYCVNDMNGGRGANIGGYYFKYNITSSTKWKLIGENTIIKTGENLLLHLNVDNGTDEKEATNGVINIYDDYSGLSSSDEQIALYNFKGELVDACAWSNMDKEMTDTQKEDMAQLISENAWQGSLDSNGTYEESCVDISSLESYQSIMRLRSSIDTDSKDDWIITSNPSPGNVNASAGVPVKFEVDSTRLAVPKDMDAEFKVYIKDAFDNLVKDTGVSVKITTNSGTASVSVDDGFTFVSETETSTASGIISIRVKDSMTGEVIVKIESISPPGLSATKTIEILETPSVVINEIMYNQSSGFATDSEGEYIELYNRSNKDFDLTGWRIQVDGKTKHTFSQGTIIKAKDYLVVCSKLIKSSPDGKAFESLYGNDSGVWGDSVIESFTAIKSDSSLSLSDTSSEVRLLSPQYFYNYYDQAVTYDDSWGADGNGPSLEKKYSDVLDRNIVAQDRYNWSESQSPDAIHGSPGKRNSVSPMGGTTDLLLSHKQDMTVPVHEPFVAYLEVISVYDITEAKFYYRNAVKKGSYKTVDMTKVPSSKLYKAYVNPALLTLDGIEYYFYVKNSNGTEKTLPENNPEASPYKTAITDILPKIRVLPPKRGVSLNEEFIVEIKLENVSEVVAATFEATFDDSVFQVIDANENRDGTQIAVGPFMEKGFNYLNEVDDNKITFGISGLKKGVSGDGILALIKFKYKNATSKTGLDVEIFSGGVKDEDDKVIDLLTFKGTIAIGTGTTELISVNGGTVTAGETSSSGKYQVTLIIPEKAVADTIRITVKKLKSTEAPSMEFADVSSEITPLPLIFEISPRSLKFKKMVTLVMHYSTDDYESVGLSSSDEKYFKIYYYRDSLSWRANKSNGWLKLGGTVETSPNNVTTKIGGGGIYALICDKSNKDKLKIEYVEISPNPISPNGNGYNDEATIKIKTSADGEMSIRIFDTEGNKVRNLLEEVDTAAGINEFTFDGKDDFGTILKTGIYIIHVFVKDTSGDNDRIDQAQKAIVISKNMVE